MHSLLRRHTFRLGSFSAFALLFVLPIGCGDERAAVAPLRERFAARAAHVLDEGIDFASSDEGFTLVDVPTMPRFVLSGRLPSKTNEPIEFTLPNGFSTRVRERTLQGEGSLVDGSVAYAREGGTSYWTTSPDAGYEEWIHFAAGFATNERPVATWDVEGGHMRQTDNAVEITDDAGEVAIVVRAPVAYTAQGKTIVPRLEVHDETLSMWVEADGEEVLVDPSWTAGPNLLAQRQMHTATRLTNGKVLIAGGGQFSGMGTFSTCDIYDATTNLITSAASMAGARQYHTATLLQDGRVLVVGGMANGLTVGTAETYNPATNLWSSAGSLIAPRHYHVAALLNDGRVLVAGGASGTVGATPLSSAEIYNPGTNTWSAATSMSTVRNFPVGTTLQNGQVLVTGGRSTSSGGELMSATLYDPATNTWSAAGNMANPRYFSTMIRLNDGRAFVLGGYGNGVNLTSAEIYNPATNTWSAAGSTTPGGAGVAIVGLADGNVLAAGGLNTGTSAASIYNPMTNLWAATNAMVSPRSYHSLTLLTNGKVLASGGYNAGVYLNTTEIYTMGNANGVACTMAAQCSSGFCVDGVCCNSACGNVCDACSVATGATVNGTCAPLTGTVCDDGSACTPMDRCQAGLCVGQNQIMCTALDQCHDVGVCNPMTGVCSNPIKANGSICNDGSLCTQVDTCQSAECVGQNPITCVALSQCHDAGVCNPMTGACSNPPKQNGAICNDGSACTQMDTCQMGLCVGQNPITCTPLDECHGVGFCDPMTGACSNPVKADGTACNDGNACSLNETCSAGTCVGTSMITCAPPNDCQEEGACNPINGTCSYPSKADGTTCNDGNACTQTDRCKAGTCQGSNTIACVPQDDCHDAGTCDPTSGTCNNPAKDDGSLCTGGVCMSGTCTPMGQGGAGGQGGTAGVGGSAGASETGGSTGGNDPTTDTGCGCRTVDDSRTASAPWLLLTGLLLARARRRSH